MSLIHPGPETEHSRSGRRVQDTWDIMFTPTLKVLGVPVQSEEKGAPYTSPASPTTR